MKHLPAPPRPLPYLMGVSSLYKPTSLSAFILVSVIFKIVSPLYVNQKSCDLHQWIALVSPFPTSATCLGTALRLGQHMHINETPPRPSPTPWGVSSLYKPTSLSAFILVSDVEAFTSCNSYCEFRLLRVAEYRILSLYNEVLFAF